MTTPTSQETGGNARRVFEARAWERQVLSTLGYWLLAPLLALLAYRRVSSFELVADARFLIGTNATLRDPGSWVSQLTRDYFWSSSGNMIPYWRPVTKLSWLLEYQSFGAWAGGYLWVQVAMHALTALATQLIARSIGLQKPFALLAGVLVALHPVAIEPVALVMARSDVAAVCFGSWSVVAWLEWRRRTRGGLPFAALHALLLALALGSKETALGWVGLLLVWVVLGGDIRRGFRHSALLIAPATALSLTYLLARRVVLAREAPGLEALHLGLDPLRVVTSLGLYLRNLLPVLESSVRNLSFFEARTPSRLLESTLALALWGVVAWILARRRQKLGGSGHVDGDVLVLLIGTLLLLFPVLLTLEISVPLAELKFPLADRWLYHALPCAAVVLSRMMELGLMPVRRVELKVSAGLLFWGWSLLVFTRSANATEEMGSELKMLDNEDRLFYEAVPPQFRTHDDVCSFQERKLVRELLKGRPLATLALSNEALELCPDSDSMKQQILEANVRLTRYQDALPLARALEHARLDGRAEGRLARNIGLTLLHTGDDLGAEPWLARAAQRGEGDCALLLQLAEAARARSDTVVAARRLESAFFCGGQRDPSLLVAAATWLTDARQVAAAERVLGISRNYRLSADQRAQAERLEAVLKGPQ